jgi:rubrerythrin
MGPVEALRVSLQRENESIGLYGDFLNKFPEAKETFYFLLNEEQKHKKLIEQKIAELQGQ